ncbi:fatty-acyl-CoA synthase [Salinibacterium amurskyense]|uniref:Fatty-acyl-CoA synthase n=1 Tax=Salinibacterium amurskyense TaxID=205941 RepID=A0A2M9D266_9MICO|nr:AMP-binding protein [Salinibacterium amurskyense]PJJ78098.1 fatty-acyl-CoA synthase [Salinibacterium amurskyense]RLQ80249.1 long-chain fatty acid--CoA ligase [Salinibacterium amurskyense]GHD82530.1 acid--CoA ligase [Salinibacterium amurskyense]
MTQSEGLHTLGRWTADRALATPDRVAVDDRGVVLTYRQLDDRATALAEAFLAGGYGVGDRIATITGNSSDHVVVFFACAKAGLVLVPLSWRLSPREIAQQLEQADPALLLVEDEFSTLGTLATDRLVAPIARGILGTHGIERDIVAPLRSEATTPVHRPVRDEDALLIIFTSGTLDQAKGAILSHANCFWTNLSLSRTAEITSADTVLAVMPQYHVGGWNIQPLLAWWMGATVVLERTFDPARVLQLIADRRITTMMGVPANYLILSQHPRFASSDLSSLAHAIVGGAPMPEPLLRVWHSRGVALTQGYGLTEAAPNVLCLPDEEARTRIGSAGKPYPHVDVDIADPVTGERIEGAGQGELLVKGPGVFSGYFRAPEATALALRNGWLATGDLVSRDSEGYYRVLDRLKDIFITGGESVAPAEIEGVLFGHPAIADVAVVGVPDEKWGEVAVAWVVVRSGASTDETDVLNFASASLAKYKVPRRVIFTEHIPRSSSDKVRRRVLLGQWTEESAQAGRISS